MGTSSGMLARARRDLGLREPNYIQSAYRERNGAAYASNFPWCDAAVTEWARASGNAKAVLPAGDRAYTVWHAGDFKKLGRWYPGTRGNVAKAQPGDIVFFDWGGTDVVGNIDHVGVVERVLPDGRLQTIEGNTADRCARRVRSHTVIAGYGRPAYDKPAPKRPASSSMRTEDIVRQLPTLKRGSRGEDVQTMQHLLLARGRKLPRFGTDGDFGAETEAALVAATGSKTCGGAQWAKLLRV